MATWLGDGFCSAFSSFRLSPEEMKLLISSVTASVGSFQHIFLFKDSCLASIKCRGVRSGRSCFISIVRGLLCVLLSLSHSGLGQNSWTCHQGDANYKN